MSSVKVSIQDPFGIWERFEKEISEFLPLQSLQIRLPSRPLSIISHLELTFTTFNSNWKESSLLNQPYNHLFLVRYESIETYRTVVRPQIRAWLQAIGKESEFLIVFVTNSQDKGYEIKGGNGFNNAFQQISGRNLLLSNFKKNTQHLTLLEKMKVDFNDNKKERVIAVSFNFEDNPNPNFECWRNLMELIKDMVTTTFQFRFESLEEEMNKLDDQRRFIGWNINPFFIIKDSIAKQLKLIHLHKEALKLYDELEALLYHCSKEDLELWFVGDKEIESINIVELLLANGNNDEKQLELIAKNQITYFEIQIYLFNQQLQLLKKMDLMLEFGIRSLKFLNTFQQYIINNKEDNIKTQIFSCSWSYLNSMQLYNNMDEHFEQIKRKDISKASSLINLNTIKSSIMYLAKTQLEKLGLFLNYLPLLPPFIHCFTKPYLENIMQDEKNLEFIYDSELKNSMISIDTFDSLYLSLNSRLISDYESDKKKRNISLIQTYMASLHYYRKRYKYTINMVEHSSYDYINEGWIYTSFELLSKLILAYNELEKHSELIRLTLKVLKFCKELNLVQNEFFVNKLIDISNKLKEEITSKAENYFNLISVEKADSFDDYIMITLKIENLLPVDLPIELIELVLSGNQNCKLTFVNESQKKLILKSGVNLIPLKCENFTIGKYFVDKILIRMNKLCFNYELIEEQIILLLNDYPQHLLIESELYMDGLILNVYTQNNSILEGELSLDILEIMNGIEIQDNYMGFILNQNDINCCQSISISCYKDINSQLTLSIPNLLNNQYLKLILPGKIMLALDIQMMINYNVYYLNNNKNKIKYNGLLTVYMEPYPFKLDYQFILDTINMNNIQYLQIKMNTINKTTGYKIESIQLFKKSIIENELNHDLSLLRKRKINEDWLNPVFNDEEYFVLLPNHTLNYLFNFQYFNKNGINGIEINMTYIYLDNDIYFVKINYTTYKKEIQLVIKKLIKSYFKMSIDSETIFKTLQQLILESGRILDYVITGQLNLKDISILDLDFSYILNEIDIPKVKQKMIGFLKKYSILEQNEIEEILKENELIQYNSLIFQQEIKLPKKWLSIEIQKIPLKMKLGEHYSIEYHLKNLNQSINELWFKINNNNEDWIITGKIKFKLEFDEQNQTHVVNITITPLKSGYLKLPQLQILKENLHGLINTSNNNKFIPTITNNTNSNNSKRMIPKPIFTGITDTINNNNNNEDLIIFDKSCLLQVLVNDRMECFPITLEHTEESEVKSMQSLSSPLGNLSFLTLE
ncbi:hypothetical protein K502DRAFT_339684 [Neoconidiobolus thromboides FSU 785]|nr:hypothetical protein K502DRAFT_339684 [Neoconidiobolus thromboides FSU 785]